MLHQKQNNNTNNMIVSNLPQFSKDTNLEQVIMKIGEQVDCNIQSGDILDAYQVENKKFKSFPLIVKLRKPELKRKCMEFRKSNKQIDITKIADNLNNGSRNINFHHLMEKELSELLQRAKEAAKKSEYKFVWFNGEAVFVRKEHNSKVIKIETPNDLNKIK